MKKQRTLKVYENHDPGTARMPPVDANVLLHGYPGGIRHDVIDLKGALRREGFDTTNNSIYKLVDDELFDYHGRTLVEAVKQAKADFPQLANLYRVVVKDPMEEVRAFVNAQQPPLSHTAEQFLFDGDIPPQYAAEQLQVSRYYRRQKGRPLDELTKWSQGGRFGNGYVAWKFECEVKGDVYHCGAGGWLGQTARGIVTDGKIRCTDPRRDGKLIELDPPEDVCVSDCAYGDADGMCNIRYFYTYYANWRDHGKKVYFKGDLCDPPDFPCKVLSTTRPHNSEFIGYTDNTIWDFPDYDEMRSNMIKANQARNKRTRDGEIEWPAYDAERVEQLLCATPDYEFQVPKVVDLSRRIDHKSRFPVLMSDFRNRLSVPGCARAYRGVSASVIVFIFLKISAESDGPVSINLLEYPYCANHQFVEELLWSFEECAEKAGLERKGTAITGILKPAKRLEFIRYMEKHVSSR